VILIDTTPLVALCDPRDALHERAITDLDRLGRRALVVCSGVLAEACFLLERPLQRQRLSRLLTELNVGALPVEEDRAVRSRVFAWLDRYAEHDPDWADALLVVTCSMDAKAKVWTYDEEFRTTWRREDGSKVPLAVRQR
jgi:predicted nucleic acid-binding protein